MHRFFADPSDIVFDKIRLCGDDARHISKVLRLRENDRIIVCDKCAVDYLCSIESIDSDTVTCSILESERSKTEPELDITLYQGIPKGDKLDTVIQKCVELGISRIVPVEMKRSVAVYKDKFKKQQRQSRIAYEAAKQCQRGRIPCVSEAMSFKEAIDDASGACLKLVPYESERVNTLKEVLLQNRSAKSIAIFIGPEGGFSDEEIKLVQEARFNIIGMGPRIMRTETAPIACIAAVMYELGDWNNN